MSNYINLNSNLIKSDFFKFTKYWLILGLIMIFFQVFLGGVTRITGSGLSITRWEIVMGSIPPLNDFEWNNAFDLYKDTPQYLKLNDGMSIKDFKFIFFWEFIHRFWARWIGLIFFAGFGYLLYNKALPRQMIKELFILVSLGGLAASFGWIMVASGLLDRPWVNAYKLSLHLNIAFLTFAYLTWIYNKYFNDSYKSISDYKLKKVFKLFLITLIVQLLLGGLMSGMKAGLVFPTWPDMNGEYLPSVLLITSNYSVDNLIQYDTFSFAPALVQFCHRLFAYSLFVILVYYIISFSNTLTKSKFYKTNLYLMFILSLQVCIGIFTVLACKGTIPIGLGVSHQAIALFVIFFSVKIIYSFK